MLYFMYEPQKTIKEDNNEAKANAETDWVKLVYYVSSDGAMTTYLFTKL